MSKLGVMRPGHNNASPLSPREQHSPPLWADELGIVGHRRRRSAECLSGALEAHPHVPFVALCPTLTRSTVVLVENAEWVAPGSPVSTLVIVD